MTEKMKKCVVTGAGGFIGRCLVGSLCAGGVPVIAADMAWPAGAPDCEFYEVDIRKPGSLDHLLNEDTTIFHMAGQASVPASVDNPRVNYEINLGGLFEVLESARHKGCRMVFPSTASVFDKDNELPVSEKSYMRPSSPYGAAKLAGEAYCAAYYRSYGVDARVARIFSVYGEGMRNFAIHDFVRKMQRDPKKLVVLGDGQQVRDYLHVEDVAGAMIDIAVNGKPGEDYNVGSGEEVRILDLTKKIADLMNLGDIEIVCRGDDRPSEVPRWFADISKLKSCGFQQKVSLDEGLQRTVDWLLNNPTDER